MLVTAVGRKAFEFLTMVSFAIPGTVIGVSYIVAFNVAPLELTGGMAILVLCFVFRNMPVGVRAGIAALAQIDRTLDEASSTLRASTVRTLFKVVLPLLRPAILATLVFSFTHAMTAVSAVIFLATAKYNLATVYIINRVEAGEYPLAIARMQKAMAVIQFKLEGQLVRRRPEYGMQDRDLLNRVDFSAGTVTLDSVTYPLKDTRFPTVDPKDPLKLSPGEEELMKSLTASFRHGSRLQRHMRFFISHGSLFLRHNGQLLYHGCVPMTAAAPLAIACGM